MYFIIIPKDDNLQSFFCGGVGFFYTCRVFSCEHRQFTARFFFKQYNGNRHNKPNLLFTNGARSIKKIIQTILPV